MALVMKDPGAVLDWPISFTLAASETIATSTWAVSPVESGGITTSAAAINANVTSCLLSGGNYRGIYLVTNTITTNQSRTDRRTITVRIGPVEAV